MEVKKLREKAEANNVTWYQVSKRVFGLDNVSYGYVCSNPRLETYKKLEQAVNDLIKEKNNVKD